MAQNKNPSLVSVHVHVNACIHSILQHVSSLPKRQLSEECCASSEPSGMDSPAQLRPSCSAMSTIFWSALSVLLREPGGEEGPTVSAAQGPALRWGRGRGAGWGGSCSPLGTALPCRQDQGNPQGRGSCHEREYDRVSPAFLPGLGTPSAGGKRARTVPAGCVPKLVSLRMLYRSRRDNGVSVLLRSSLPLPCESGDKPRGHQLEKRAAALPWHRCFSCSLRAARHGHNEQLRKKS